MKKGHRRKILIAVWLFFLITTTLVLIFAPRGNAAYGQNHYLKIFVIAICWLIGIFALTPLSKSAGKIKLLPEKWAFPIIISLLLLFLTAVFYTAIIHGKTGAVIVGVIAAYAVIKVLIEFIRQSRKKREKKLDDRKNSDQPTE
jgi:amino acid transporter